MRVIQLSQSLDLDDDPHQQPFRFSASPSDPARASSPVYNFTAPGASASTSSIVNGKKVLTKNPNGTYRFQGGGSSRPRNRYQSPVFGHPQATLSKIKITPEKPKTDAKRRRTSAAQPETSTAQRTTADAGSSRPTVNGTTEASTSLSNITMNGASSSFSSSSSASGSSSAAPSSSAPRVRTTGFTKPTAPAIPSPLRQAWGQSDSPPQSSRQVQQPVRPTRAASTLTEILKEVSPPKKPEFVNPYEAASPIPLRAAARKPAAQRRTRAAAKAAAAAAAQEKAKAKSAQKSEQKLTVQEIIEATVPKVSV